MYHLEGTLLIFRLLCATISMMSGSTETKPSGDLHIPKSLAQMAAGNKKRGKYGLCHIRYTWQKRPI